MAEHDEGAAEASTGGSSPPPLAQPRRPIVVVGFDFSDTGDHALEHAVRLATRQHAEPHVVHVAAAVGPMLRLELPDQVVTVGVPEASDRLRAAVEARFDLFRDRYGDALIDFERAVTHVRVGTPAEEIAQLAADLGADLVIVGTHGRRGFRRLLVGSVAESTVRMAPCPVLVVRPRVGDSSTPSQLQPAL